MRLNKNVLCAGFLLWQAAGWGQSLRDDLIKQFSLTQVSADGTVLKAGAVMVLQKNGLLTYGCNAPLPALNTWKNGKLSAGMGRALTVGMAMNNQGSTNLPMRKFVTGESFWIIGTAVEKDQMVFRLLSDPVMGILYCADLKFPFPKNNPPPLDQAIQQIAEVLTLQPAKPAETDTAPAGPVLRPKPQPSAASDTTEPAAATATAMTPILPPPPPVESKTVELGDTPEKVIATLGQPKNIVNLGAKQIFIYANLKVTFENGKVTDSQ